MDTGSHHHPDHEGGAGMKRILVGVDGFEPAVAALGWARRIAEHTGAELILANIVHPPQSVLPEGRVDVVRAENVEHLLEHWSSSRRDSTVTCSTLRLSADPDALLKAADERDVDLVVVGIHRHGAVAALHMGGLAHHLAHITGRPLAIIPETAADRPIDHIVVGVDGSDGSRAATNWTGRLAVDAEATVLAAYVMEPPPAWVPRSEHRGWGQRAQAHLDEWVTPLHEAGISTTTTLTEDFHPVAALSAIASDTNAGLIVVGTSRASRTVGMRLGRVPLQLTHHAQLPIVLVPPATGAH